MFINSINNLNHLLEVANHRVVGQFLAVLISNMKDYNEIKEHNH